MSLPRNWRKTYTWKRSGRLRVGDILVFRSGKHEVVDWTRAKYSYPAQHLTCFVFRAPRSINHG